MVIVFLVRDIIARGDLYQGLLPLRAPPDYRSGQFNQQLPFIILAVFPCTWLSFARVKNNRSAH